MRDSSDVLIDVQISNNLYGYEWGKGNVEVFFVCYTIFKYLMVVGRLCECVVRARGFLVFGCSNTVH